MNRIAVFPGDGIGIEVTAQALKVLRKVEGISNLKFETEELLAGGASIDKHGVPLTPEALEKAKKSDAVFLGAVGGPKWDALPSDKRPEKGLLGLRKGLNAYANLRPVKMFSQLVARSPLKEEVVKGLDFIILRELVSGVYFGMPRGIEKLPNGEERGFNTMAYTASEVQRIARMAFEFARKRRKKLTSVDKANVLDVSQLWRKVVVEVAKGYPDVELSHRYVDDCAMQLIRDPKQFDVIVTSNLFGDILSDESAMLTGSIGMLPSASLGDKVAMYEPVHGSAPDIAGKDMANPLATILSLAMMLEYSFHQSKAARAVEAAVEKTLAEGYRSADIYTEGTTKVGCAKMGDLVVERIH
ncbi:MAG TPA: 3-isopropylmalate dehydrogenase [Candidatus Omnitrophota bacterium]|nr:3-isopropylmalate dehydrogenase [Candidatus Omnitrophota bacterium]HPS36431.1 3-isopropylmalate dehydrogenase [Candidatus Omnitrophota bacterium]